MVSYESEFLNKTNKLKESADVFSLLVFRPGVCSLDHNNPRAEYSNHFCRNCRCSVDDKICSKLIIINAIVIPIENGQ
jgi:hypothetical protein